MYQIDVYNDCMKQTDVELAALDLNLITALSALLDHGSVSKAAEAVGRTQSAMSHSLSRLRDHFRDPLLVRNGWGMLLTPFAEELRPRVSAASEAAKLVFATNFGFEPAKTTRRIRIAAPDLCSSLFTGLISDLGTKAPLASVEFLETRTARNAVLRSDADIGLGFGFPKSDPNLKFHEISPLDWCTFAPIDHDYSQRPSVETWCASRHILVGQGSAQDGPVEKILRKNGIERHVVGYTSNFSAALILASETGALFTTLRAPFEETAKRLGMGSIPLPFPMPNASTALMFRSDYGDPFSIWLKDLCLKALS